MATRKEKKSDLRALVTALDTDPRIRALLVQRLTTIAEDKRVPIAAVHLVIQSLETFAK